MKDQIQIDVAKVTRNHVAFWMEKETKHVSFFNENLEFTRGSLNPQGDRVLESTRER